MRSHFILFIIIYQDNEDQDENIKDIVINKADDKKPSSDVDVEPIENPSDVPKAIIKKDETLSGSSSVEIPYNESFETVKDLSIK